ncbi:MAG: hypothetical protein LBV21_01100, partial [Candidatus Adiutrix sp.]|nr:hypothetical protein [Candidatus Adiutrix sp.]
MGNAIDELFIKIGLDSSGLKQGLQEVELVINSIDSGVKSFGEGLTSGLGGAEAAAGTAGAAVAEVGAEAQAAGAALEEAGKAGEAGLKQTAGAAKKAAREVGALEKRVDAVAKKIGQKLGRNLSRMFMGLAAPVLGMMAVSGVIKKYTEDMEKLDELSKKRNLSLKERQEKQKLLKEYNEKDLESYRKIKKATDDFKETMGGLGKELMRFGGPYIMAALQGLKDFASFLGKNEKFVKILAGIITAVLVPALAAMAAAWLATPFPWIIIGLVAVAALIDDLTSYAKGAKSALPGLWELLGTPEEVLQGLESITDNLKNVWDWVIAIKDVFMGFVKIIPTMIEALISGDMRGLRAAYDQADRGLKNMAELWENRLEEQREKREEARRKREEARRKQRENREKLERARALDAEIMNRPPIEGVIPEMVDMFKVADDVFKGAAVNAHQTVITPRAEGAPLAGGRAASGGPVDNSKHSNVEQHNNTTINAMTPDPQAIAALLQDTLSQYVHTVNAAVKQ